jgi:hypothetical protein
MDWPSPAYTALLQALHAAQIDQDAACDGTDTDDGSHGIWTVVALDSSGMTAAECTPDFSARYEQLKATLDVLIPGVRMAPLQMKMTSTVLSESLLARDREDSDIQLIATP